MAAMPSPEDASAIEGLTDADSTAGAVPPPCPDAPFKELDSPIDERRARVLPDDDDDNLLFERRDAFDLVALGPGGGVALPLYGRAKFLKSLDFNGVLRGQTFMSHIHMSERRGTQEEREGRHWLNHMDKDVEGST